MILFSNSLIYSFDFENLIFMVSVRGEVIAKIWRRISGVWLSQITHNYKLESIIGFVMYGPRSHVLSYIIVLNSLNC